MSPQAIAAAISASHPRGTLLAVAWLLGTVAMSHAAACTRTSSPPSLPVYDTLPEFQLTDQDGQPLTRGALMGHVTVVDFVFTRCPTVCPTLTARMVALHERVKHVPRVRFVSISVDPTYDQPERLKAYARKHGADTPTWRWATGDPHAIVQVVREGFKQAVHTLDTQTYHERPEDVVHSTRFVLVDSQARLRGFYSSGDADDIQRLESAIAALAGR
jgi:protein SCO1/2